ncbi:MAG: C25 family cysteine peptidase [Patescibacteria group bacterium]
MNPSPVILAVIISVVVISGVIGVSYYPAGEFRAPLLSPEPINTRITEPIEPITQSEEILSFTETIDKDEIKILSDEGDGLVRLSDKPLITIAGKPRIPFSTENILIPFGKEVSEIAISKRLVKSVNLLEDIEITGHPIPLTYFNLEEFFEEKLDGRVPSYFYDEGRFKEELFLEPKIDTNILENRFWPYNDYEYFTQDIHGRKILVLNTYPVKYNPITRELRFYDFDVNVKLKDIPTTGNPKQSERVDKRVEEIVTQKDSSYSKSLSSYKKTSSLPLIGKAIASPSDTYEHVIITTDQFKGSWSGNCLDICTLFSCLTKYKTCRTENPITATIVTKEQILVDPDYNCNSSYIVNLGNSIGMDFSDNYCDVEGHNDDATKIRNFIRDAYVNWDTEYVLLGGDADLSVVGGETQEPIIPVRYLNPDGFYSEGPGIPSDLYYAGLGGSFDSTGDGVFGMPEDGVGGGEIDLLAEVYTGRVPVDSQDEVNRFVTKTLNYENLDPASSPYLSNALIVGEVLGFGGISQYAKSTLEEVHDGSVEHGYITSGLPPVYNIDTMYQQDYFWETQDILDRINQDDIHIIHHLGHSNTIFNMGLCHSNYTEPGVTCGNEGRTDLDLLTNNNYFVGYSQGCYPGSFDNFHPGNITTYSDSFMEHMILDDNKAFAYIANTRYGWGMYYSTDGPSNRYHREFIDALYNERLLNIGKAQQDSKEDNVHIVAEHPVYRFVYYESTLFGDPEVKIKIPEPEKPVSDLLIKRGIMLGEQEIIGSATQGFSPGATFENYSLEYKHVDDLNWSNAGFSLINNGQQAIAKSVLATFDPSFIRQGINEFKITGVDESGRVTTDTVTYDADNVVINSPEDNLITGVHESLLITGTASGKGFIGYVLEYGIGTNPTQWYTENIIIENEGTAKVNGGLLGTWDLSNFETGYYTIKLTVGFEGGEVITEFVTIHVDAELKQGYPKQVDKMILSTGYFVNLDSDDELEMLFATMTNDGDQGLQALNLDGTPVEGSWPNVIGDYGYLIFPSVGDVNLDGDNEIIVSSYPDRIFGFNLDGYAMDGEWPITFDGETQRVSSTGVTIANLDGDPDLEFIIPVIGSPAPLEPGQVNHRLYAYNHDATPLTGWPVDLPYEFNEFFFSPNVADIDNDGNPEVVMGNYDKIYVFNHDGSIYGNWPFEASEYEGFEEYRDSPAIGDIDADGILELAIVSDTRRYINMQCHCETEELEIACDDLCLCSNLSLCADSVIRAPNSTVYVFNSSKAFEENWPVNLPHISERAFQIFGIGNTVPNPPVLANLDNDQELEIIFIDGNNTWAFDSDGQVLTGWPVRSSEDTNVVGRKHQIQPLVLDVDGDKEVEIVINGGHYMAPKTSILVYETDGSPITGWDKVIKGWSYANPFFGDPDNDGYLEMAMGSRDGELYLWELDVPYYPALLEWPMHKYNPQHLTLYKRPPFNKVQTFTLEANTWDWISFNVLPADKNLESVFGDNLQYFNVIYTGDDVDELRYEPAQGIYTLTEIDYSKSYKVYPSQDVTLSVMRFNTEFPLEIPLKYYKDNDLNYIGYPLDYETSVEYTFSSIMDKIVMIKDQYGKIYVPGIIETLNTLQPGEGYEISVNQDVNFTYDKYTCGDVDADGELTALDLGYLIDYLFVGGAEPVPVESGDIDGSGEINALDLGWLIDILFAGAENPNKCGTIPIGQKSVATQAERQQAQQMLNDAGINIQI